MLQKSPETVIPAVSSSTPDITAVLKAGAPSRRWRSVVAVMVVLAGAAGGWLWLSSRSNSGATAYTTAAVTRGDLTVTVTATGTVQPTNQVDISSELSGTVASVDADFNDHVAKGETLATLA